MDTPETAPTSGDAITPTTPASQRIVAVTGGALGIGGAISRMFAAEGDHVVMLDIDSGAADATAAEIRALDGTVTVVVGDATTDEGLDALAGAVAVIDGGRIDVLVNNVGDFRPKKPTFLHSDPAHWDLMHRINFWHVLGATHRLAPAMVERGRGVIVNVSTVEAYRGIPGNTVYSAYNAAVSAFTKSLAIELAPAGVRVVAIAPDLADTEQTPAELMLGGRDPEMIKSWIPLGRFGQPDDFAQVVSFLASDAAGFITGQTIPVDGGTLAASGWYKRSARLGWSNLPDQV